MADEQVVLIADIIDDFITSPSCTEDDGKKLELFKVSLLELSYEGSCYNFDVQLSLVKSFDRLGWSTSFSESFETLGIKGV